jgi:hypothetical protein
MKLIFNYRSSLLLIVCCFNLSLSAQKKEFNKNEYFEPGKVWLDTEGHPIVGHGAGLLFHEGVYYWYGETRTSIRTFPGFSCYSSTDLLNWKNEGYALVPVKDNPEHELYETNIIERPKVIYNDRTKKFVMWMHVEDNKYQKAHAGVAIADKPTGPFQFIKSIKPNGAESRDESIFKDDDGKAYLIHASEQNSTQHINLLTEDYLDVEGSFVRVWLQEWREAPSIFKYKGKYYSVTSRCTGFSPNEAKYAVADNMLGEWKIVGNPAVGLGSESCFRSQAAYVLPVANQPGKFIYVGDRWTPGQIADSRYVWLPIVIKDDGTLKIEWKDKWNFNSAPNGNYAENPQGEELQIYKVGQGFPLTNRKPDVLIKRRTPDQDFSALGWLGWREGKMVYSIIIYPESSSSLDGGNNSNSSGDLFDIWMNFYQVSVQRNGRVWREIPGSSGYGDLGGILLTQRYAHPALKCTKQENVTSEYGKLLQLPVNQKSILYQVEVDESLAPMKPLKETQTIAFALVTNNRDVSGKGIKNRGYAPLGWSWADTDTYYKLILTK